MNKTNDSDLAQRLDAVADALTPAAQRACGCTLPTALRERLHAQAAQTLARRRLFRERLRALLATAAAAAIFIVTSIVALRPSSHDAPLPPNTHREAALGGIMLVAGIAPEALGDDSQFAQNGSTVEMLAWRLLAAQGFVDHESEALLQ